MRADKDNSLAGLAASQAQLGWDDMGHGEITKSEIKMPASALSSPKGRRAAFTLRLDAERHFKLRLASTLQDCSAQQLVTEALDRFLDDIPHLNELAAHAGQSRNQA